MKQHLHIITLGVSDLQKSLTFYEAGLKWKRSDASNENIAFFPVGGIVLALFSRAALAEDANQSNETTGFSGITIAHNTHTEAEVDAVLKEVELLGAEIVKQAEKVSWGGYSGYFRDPDGHLFEVAYNPHADFDKNGNLDI